MIPSYPLASQLVAWIEGSRREVSKRATDGADLFTRSLFRGPPTPPCRDGHFTSKNPARTFPALGHFTPTVVIPRNAEADFRRISFVRLYAVASQWNSCSTFSRPRNRN